MVRVFERPGCKLNYKVPILASRALILKPWAPKVVLQRPAQGFERSRCRLNYKVPILAPRVLIRKPWAPMVVLQRLVKNECKENIELVLVVLLYTLLLFSKIV